METVIDLSKILSRYSNEWVALSHDERKVMGHGETITQAVMQARKRGEKDPVLTRVPKDYSTYIL